ncbi:hypothetical protein NDU88_004989 [Pleurodeles waltl]|uniref:Uncharacterized protein n=1 Tax=Pleurodeles waltl TaxID=8319 RepID=A0AAV7WZF3_PLEWA|nr:hypothetical protein NDU88_004989 [Pleurodeles waltl]
MRGRNRKTLPSGIRISGYPDSRHRNEDSASMEGGRGREEPGRRRRHRRSEERDRLHLTPLSPDSLTILTRFKELRTEPRLTLPSFRSWLPWRQRSPRELRRDPRGPKREKRKERMLH